MTTLTTLIPAKPPICQCHLWIHVIHDTQLMSQGKRDTQAEYLTKLKKALQKTIQNITFADTIQSGRAHEALMCDVNSLVRCIGTKYSVKVGQVHSNIR